MENSYEVNISNRYSLFLDDEIEDPCEVLKSKEKDKEKKRAKLADIGNTNKVNKTETIKPKGDAHKDVKSQQNAKVTERKEPDTKGKVSLKNKDDNTSNVRKESRGQANTNRSENVPAVAEDLNVEGEFKTDYKEYRGKSRGSLRGRGGRDFRGQGRGVGPNRFKREYDRQSGSDRANVKPTDKRSGDGPYNWGSDRNEIAQEMLNATQEGGELRENQDENSSNEEVVTEEKANVDVKNTENADAENANQSDEVKMTPTMTLDEYKALKANKKKPTYNLRKPGEGEDPKQWKKMYALPKKKDGEVEENEEFDDFSPLNYPQRVGRQKYLLDIDIRFADTGVRRGARGRGRGGRGHAADDGPSAPKVDDERDFPSLAGGVKSS